MYCFEKTVMILNEIYKKSILFFEYFWLADSINYQICVFVSAASVKFILKKLM